MWRKPHVQLFAGSLVSWLMAGVFAECKLGAIAFSFVAIAVMTTIAAAITAGE